MDFEISNNGWFTLTLTLILQVIAYDRGTPSLTGTTTVQVDITDINNKKPTFSVGSQSVHISESMAVDTVFFTYPATDLDETAVLEYSLLQSETVGEDEDKEPVTNSPYLQVRNQTDTL